MNGIPLRTNTDFSRDYTMLYSAVKQHNVAVTPEIINFITAIAEVMAELHAENRHLYNILHSNLNTQE